MAFQLLWAIGSVVNQTLIIVTNSLFVCVYVGFIIKQPIFCYQFDTYMKQLINIVAFSSLIRITALVTNQPDPLLMWLIGNVTFCVFIHWICNLRVKRLLKMDRTTVKQVKILMYLSQNIQDNLDLLALFIV